MSPKQQRGEATADLLLEAALRVYAVTGDNGLTVTAVTAASGVSMGSLYHHFGSIEGLSTALHTRWNSRLLDALLTALVPTRTLHTGVRALVRAYLAFIQEHRDAALFLHSSGTSRDAMRHGRQVHETQEARLAELAGWLGPRVAAGEIAPLPAPLIEALVMGPVVATARRWLSGAGEVDLEEAVRLLPDRICRSLAP
ncbi:TetR family transcriptional regulator [Streptomyces sp. SAT1]|uniref:TetR/AcrR family transcriptional regulator n=1 Tax=Streptomyces sp. SAT1 TaxID=1849967 RepID=UPI0007DE1E4B|nr:TetR/AcrR family transcriptional regulator [Streptomyces sp. SAT1]ANH92812.1 TetR family transcriptional regulator [Streptomyces sp. SAT1]